MTAESGEPAIEQIENAGSEDEPDGVMKIGGRLEEIDLLRPIVDPEDGGEPAEEVAGRHQVGEQINFRAAGRVHIQESRAIGLAPPATRSPTRTSTVALSGT